MQAIAKAASGEGMSSSQQCLSVLSLHDVRKNSDRMFAQEE